MQFIQFFFLSLDCHNSFCSPLDSSQMIYILKFGVCLNSWSNNAKNTKAVPASQKHWKWPIFYLLFWGKMIKYYFRQLSSIHVYNYLLTFPFFFSGFSEANYWHLRFRWSGDAPSELLRKFRNYEIWNAKYKRARDHLFSSSVSFSSAVISYLYFLFIHCDVNVVWIHVLILIY